MSRSQDSSVKVNQVKDFIYLFSQFSLPVNDFYTCPPKKISRHITKFKAVVRIAGRKPDKPSSQLKCTLHCVRIQAAGRPVQNQAAVSFCCKFLGPINCLRSSHCTLIMIFNHDPCHTGILGLLNHLVIMNGSVNMRR